MPTWLTKVASILLEAGKIVTGIGPVLTAAAPNEAGVITATTNDLTEIGAIITQVETMSAALKAAPGGPALTGEQKLAAAVPAVSQIVMTSELLIGKSIGDAAKFQAACAGIASNVADLLNSLKPNVTIVNKA